MVFLSLTATRPFSALALKALNKKGNDAEAAQFAVAQGHNVKLLIDDSDVTIVRHPSDYLKGYNVSKSLREHAAMHKLSTRRMSPGIADIEGISHGHDVIPVKSAVKYLQARASERLLQLRIHI